MTPEQDSLPTREDRALLGRILRKLTAAPRIASAVLVVVIALVWYDLLNRLLAFGRGINYSGAHFIGAEASALLQQYNPYFWWTLVILCTILIAYLLTLAVRAVNTRVRARSADAGSVAQLTERLSAPALQVLLWAWQSHDEPLRVGDLQVALHELRNGRAASLQQAARQRAALQTAYEQKSLQNPAQYG